MSRPDPAINPLRLRRLLSRLLDIYSPSGKEEDLVDYLYRYLKRQGLPAVRQVVDENRDNLIVSSSEEGAALAFIGHVDTVTAYDLDEFRSEKDGDVISGLGAADMKGGCAAMIEAFSCLWQRKGRDFPLMLALVVGEEEEGDGAERLVKDFRFPWAIIGEPTGLEPCLSHYGYLAVQLTTHGRRLHASLAQKGRNAVEHMLKTLLSISRYLEEERPELVYNVRDLFSSGAGFVVPDGCEAWLDIHLPPAAPVSEIAMEIEDLVAQEHKVNRGLEATLHFDTVQAGYNLSEKWPVIEALKAVFAQRGLKWKPLAFPSHSDANQLWSAGVRPIILGPGHLEMAHGPDESISFTQVYTAAEIYYELGLRLISDNKAA